VQRKCALDCRVTVSQINKIILNSKLFHAKGLTSNTSLVVVMNTKNNKHKTQICD